MYMCVHIGHSIHVCTCRPQYTCVFMVMHVFLNIQERFMPGDINALVKLIDQDPLAQLEETEKELVWKMR